MFLEGALPARRIQGLSRIVVALSRRLDLRGTVSNLRGMRLAGSVLGLVAGHLERDYPGDKGSDDRGEQGVTR
jgi:hypothetical protein